MRGIEPDLQEPSGLFAIYSRKSRFTGQGESVENQVEMCRAYLAERYGRTQAETALVYEDEGFSGGNLERPRFRQMMEDSHRQKFAAIVVYRLDRISRNIGDFARLIEDLGSRGIDFRSIREQFDTSSPMGRAMMYIASVFSQLERETIAERIRDNMHELAKTGRWLGGTTPIGYRSERVSRTAADGKTRRVCRLTPVPEELDLVRTIYDRFLDGGSLTSVDRYLLEHRVKTRRGNDFTRFAIREILTNPVYMAADPAALEYLREQGVELCTAPERFDGTYGMMVYNRTLQKPGKTNQRNPMDQWIAAVGDHPGVISGARWTEVQKRLEHNRGKGAQRTALTDTLLSGLLVCGACGNAMRCKVSGKSRRDGSLHYIYICTGKERRGSGACSMKNADGPSLDRAVRNWLHSLGADGNSGDERIELPGPPMQSHTESEQDRVRARVGKAVWDGRTLRLDLCGTGNPVLLCEDSK